jgi:hypothetical protein
MNFWANKVNLRANIVTIWRLKCICKGKNMKIDSFMLLPLLVEM